MEKAGSLIDNHFINEKSYVCFIRDIVNVGRLQKLHLIWLETLVKVLSMSEESFRSIAYEPHHEKTCLMPYANNKDADQSAHPCSLFSDFSR